MDHSKKSTYLFSIDALRVISILAVVLIHQTTTTLQILNHNVPEAPFSLFLNQASRFAVPLFFLISGFVMELNNKNHLSYLTFFKKRASRILVPFIFWSALYFYIGNKFSITNLASYNFIEDLITGQAAYHLYFIPTLIIFYLIFPFLHKILTYIKNPLFLIFIFIIQLTVAFYNYYVKSIPIHQDLQVAILVFSMFIIGMTSSHYKDQIFSFAKKYLLFLSLILLAVAIYIYVHVYDLTVKLQTTSFIYNQYGPLNYIYTVIFALVFSYVIESKQILKGFFIMLSKLSFFVFFIHVFILQNVWAGVIKSLIEKNGDSLLKNYWFDPLIFTIVCFISFLIAFTIHKIPYASKITG